MTGAVQRTDHVRQWLWELRVWFWLHWSTCREQVVQSRRSDRCISPESAVLIRQTRIQTRTHTCMHQSGDWRVFGPQCRRKKVERKTIYVHW